MNTVCVFTMKGCPYCESLKKRLSSMDILFEEYDVDDNPILWGQITNELKGNQLARFRNERLGFIFQFHQLLPEFTALENVIIPALLGQRSKNDALKKGAELLDFLGLAHRLEHKPNALSGGEQQRVAVARALINDPDIIFADEPSGNLDSKNSQELHELFFRLKAEMDQTFVIVTHNRELAAMSDRTLEMRDGVIVNTHANG